MTEASRGTMLVLLSRLFRAALGVGALAIALLLFAYLVGSKPEPDRSGGADRAPSVTTVPLRHVDVARVWDGYGTARAMNAVDLSAEVTGVVLARPADVEAGRAVTAGQSIVTIDPEDFRQRLEAQTQMLASLEAELDGLDAREQRLREQLDLAKEEARLAENDYRRTAESLERGGANEPEVEAALSAFRRAQRAAAAIGQALDTIPSERAGLRARVANQNASIRLAERELERTAITSPIGGLLQMVDAEEGELLTPGHLVARVVDLTRIEVPIRLPVSAGSSVVVGDHVQLRADSALEAEWEGTIVGIAPEADASSRSLTAFVEVRQDISDALRERRAVNTEGGRLLLPGQFVVASVTTSVREPRFVVPRTAVERDRIMVIETNSEPRARRTPVRVLFHIDAVFPELDPRETQWAVIDDTPELREGTLVITSNLDELAPGDHVRTRDPEAIARDGAPGGTP